MSDAGRHVSDRGQLRVVLRAAYPWLDEADRGPRVVVAGECERCGRRPRVVPTCGPVAWEALCDACAIEVGLEAWCDGHRDEARSHLRWAAELPPEWPHVVRLWWVATGEVRLEELVVPPRVRAQLPPALRSAVEAELPEPEA